MESVITVNEWTCNNLTSHSRYQIAVFYSITIKSVATTYTRVTVSMMYDDDIILNIYELIIILDQES